MVLTQAEIDEILKPYAKWVRKKEFELDRLLARWDKDKVPPAQRKAEWGQFLYHQMMDHRGQLRRIEKAVREKIDVHSNSQD